MELPDAWIETTSYHEENRTLWVVKMGGEIVKVGETIGDPSGVSSYEIASAWARVQFKDVAFAWKHWDGAARRQ